MEKSYKDLNSSIGLIELHLSNYYDGHTDCYKSISVELRKLLCDSNPLLPRVYSDFKLHKFHSTKLFESHPNLAEGNLLTIGGRICKKENETTTFKLLFDKSFEIMDVKDWIYQSILTSKITIKELIKSVADKEGAHSDPNYNDTLNLTKSLMFIDIESQVAIIIGIAEYVLSVYKNYIGL